MTSFADPGQQSGGDTTRDVQVNLNADVSGYTSQVSAAQMATAGLATTVDKLSISLSSLTKFAGKQLFHFAAAGAAGITGAIADAAALEHQMGTLRATAAVTGSSMADMGKGLDEAFSQFPVARRDLIQLAETISNVGVTAPKAVTRAVGTFTKMGFATGENPNQLATGQLQLGRMMGNTSPDDTDKYANSVLLLNKNFGVAASSIQDFAQGIAPMARAAGIGQAAVQGMATAFSAAGANGGYAVNTLNKVVTEIQTMKETGDPSIGKYATFLGETKSQFRNQNATQSTVQLFNQIGKGGPEALNFMSSLGLGPRDLKAVQAVAQSGQLGSAIDTAKQGAAGGTGDLDTAAKAAMGGLTNSMTDLGNQFLKLGEIIGGPFLGLLTTATKAFGSVVSGINKVLGMMGPIPGIVAGLLTALAVPAGLALTHFGITTALAMGQTVNKSGTMGALRAGGIAGRAYQSGAMTSAEAMAASAVGTRVMNQEARFAERTAYNYGMNRAYNRAQAGSLGFGSRLGSAFNTGSRGLMGAATWGMNAYGFRQGTPTFRESLRTGSVPGMARAGVGMVTSTVTRGAQGLAAMGGVAARAVTPGILAPAAGLAARGLGAVASFAINPITLLAGMVAVPLVSHILSSIKETNAKKTDISAGLTGAGVYDQGLDRVSTNLARFGDSLDAASNKLSKFADVPVSKLGTVSDEDVRAAQGGDYKVDDPKFEATVRQAQKNAAKTGGSDKEQSKIVDKAVTDYLNAQAQEGTIKGDAVKKYTRDTLYMLGTDKRDEVSGIMTPFTQNLGKDVLPTPDYNAIGQRAGTTEPDEAGREDYKKVFGSGFTSLGSGSQLSDLPGSRFDLSQLLNMGAASVSTAGPGQADKIKMFEEFLKKGTGVDPKEFDKAVQDIAKEKGTSKAVVSTDSSGSYAGRLIAPFGSEADAQKNFAEAFSRTTKGQKLMTAYQWSPQDLQAAVQNPGDLPPPSESGAAIALKKQGPLGQWAGSDKGFIKAAVGGDSGKAGAEFAASVRLVDEAAKEAGGNYAVASTNIQTLADAIGGADDSTTKLLESAANWAATLAGFDFPTLSRGEQYTTALSTSKRDMAAALKPDASDPTKAKGAASLQAFKGVEAGDYANYISLIKTGNAFVTSHDRAIEANTEQKRRTNRDFGLQQGYAHQDYTTQRERSETQFGIQKQRATLANTTAVNRSNEAYTIQRGYAKEDFKTQKQYAKEDFDTQQLNAQKDYQIQRSRSQEDFGIQRLRAVEDNNTQVLRSQQDFQLNSQRSQEDYQTNVGRQTEDHLRDLKRQAEASAQEIYDPYTRVQTKATTDAGTLIYNLKEQNADIERQMKEIKELKDKGISQQTIDTLKLGDAGNAQQVTTLNDSLTQNPGMANQINAQINTRVTDTKKLTQDPSNNVAFRQGEEDYHRSMSRGATDFEKTQKRAREDYSKTMKHLSEDFTKTQRHAADDQTRTLRHMAEDFDKSQKVSSDAYARSMKRMGDEFVKTDKRASDAQALSLKHMGEDFKLQQAQAQADQTTALTNMQKDYVKVRDQALLGHQNAMADLALDFTKTQKQAAQDLMTSLTEYSGSFGTVMGQMIDLYKGKIKTIAPEVTALVLDANQKIADAIKTPLQVLTTGPAAIGNLGPNYNIPQTPSALTPHAYGGISLTRQQVSVGEHGPELHLPLNSRGENFLAGMIAKSLARGITGAISGGPAEHAGSTCNDYSVNFSGADIRVEASDPNVMAKELAARAKLARLASPVRH